MGGFGGLSGFGGFGGMNMNMGFNDDMFGGFGQGGFTSV